MDWPDRYLTLNVDHAENIPIFVVKEFKNRSFLSSMTHSFSTEITSLENKTFIVVYTFKLSVN